MTGFSFARFPPGFNAAEFQPSHLASSPSFPDDDLAPLKYTKVPTELFYESDDAAPLWGWQAYLRAKEVAHQPWQHQTRFKLHLADDV